MCVHNETGDYILINITLIIQTLIGYDFLRWLL